MVVNEEVDTALTVRAEVAGGEIERAAVVELTAGDSVGSEG